VVLSEAAFGRTQIARRGNAIVWRLLFRIAGGSDVGQLKAKLQQLFPDGQVVGYRDHNDLRAAAALNVALTYLDLTAWTNLLIGSLGVAMVIYLHIEQRLDTVAILKLLGGRWSQIASIYLLEITCLSLAGSAIGVVLAIPLERILQVVVSYQSPFPIVLPWRWSQAGEGIGLGVVSSLVAAAVPLMAVRTTAPLLVLRRYVERPANSRQIARMVGTSSVLVMTALAVWMLHSWKAGAAFLLGLAAGGLILLSITRGLLRMVGWAGRHWRIYSMRNLCRPGRHAGSRFLALSVGVMVVTASWLGPAAVARAIEQSLPLPGADLFVFGLGPGQAGPLLEILARNPDVKPPVELLPMVILRLSKVADVPAPASTPERWVATCSDAPPAGPLTAGRWWQPGAVMPEAVVGESLAGMLDVRLGQTLDFSSNGRTVRARVVGLRRMGPVEESLHGGLILPCTAFAGLSVFYEAGIFLKEGRAEAVRRMVAARYPSIPVISRSEVAAVIQSVGHDAIWILRAVSLLILAAGTAVLVLMVLAEEETRSREIAILKTLGARPAQVRNALLAEFAWLGALAGAGGGVMGSGFATLLLSVVFRKVSPAWDARVFAGAILLGILTAVGAGWTSSARMLRQKPLAILRDE
jgi:putative ABC transport system permease protein